MLKTKHLFALLLTLAMIFSFVGCGQATMPNNGDKTPPNDTSATDHFTGSTESPDLDTSTDESHASYSPFGSVQVGDVIFFGRYEQDDNTENGPEEIPWIVLDSTGLDIFVISAQIIEYRRYDRYDKENPDRDYTHTDWEQCWLRGWLNKNFYEEAFTGAERNIINLSEVENVHQITETTFREFTTQDYIFLLSLDELEQYFPSYDDKMSMATDYVFAKADGSSEGASSWWLRTVIGTYISMVQPSGVPNGHSVANYFGVRPAMWLHIG